MPNQKPNFKVEENVGEPDMRSRGMWGDVADAVLHLKPGEWARFTFDDPVVARASSAIYSRCRVKYGPNRVEIHLTEGKRVMYVRIKPLIN